MTALSALRSLGEEIARREPIARVTSSTPRLERSLSR
jgi:hypothetical protein